MTRYEQIQLHAPCLKELKSHGLRVKDLWKAEVYEQVLGLAQGGVKTEYCVAMVAEAHNISERYVWKIMAQMREEVPQV